MKLLSACIIACLLFTSCQQNQEREATNDRFKSIESPAGSDASLPYLTKGEDGRLYMSWVEKKDSSWIDLKYSVWQNEAWQQPEIIASGNDWFVNWADYPMMAVDNLGNMIAHFPAKSSSGTYSYDVNVVYKPAGGEWLGPIIPHKDGTPTEHGFVTILPKNDGTFLLSWLDGRNTGGGDHDSGGHGGGGAMTIRTATLDMIGNLTQEAELDSRVCDCCQTAGAMTTDGPIIIYRDRSEEELRDMSFVRWDANKWSAPKQVNKDGWKIAGCPVNGPRIATFENTTATAWFTAAEGTAKVKVAFMDSSGATFEAPIIIDDSISVGRVDIVMMDEQTAVVSWLDLEGEKSLIKSRKVSKDGSLGDPTVVAETSASRGSGFPQMEKIDGALYFAWTNVGEEETTVQIKKLRL